MKDNHAVQLVRWNTRSIAKRVVRKRRKETREERYPWIHSLTDGCGVVEMVSVVGGKEDEREVFISKPDEACRASMFSLLTGEPIA